MPKNDLITKPEELRSQIVKEGLGLKTHKTKNTNVVKILRRKLAQVLTRKRLEELYAKS